MGVDAAEAARTDRPPKMVALQENRCNVAAAGIWRLKRLGRTDCIDGHWMRLGAGTGRAGGALEADLRSIW